MIDPAVALTLALGVATAAVLLLWPVRGLLWRWLRGLRATERVLIEDALKHLFDFEYKDRVANLQSLSGALAVSGNRAAELLRRLQEQELVGFDGDGYRLTPAGRKHALRVVRIHRLWERYLADETGLAPDAWHPEAEIREHTTTPEEADVLSARMGHPRFDPHGDPIPTADGEIAPLRGPPADRARGRRAGGDRPRRGRARRGLRPARRRGPLPRHAGAGQRVRPAAHRLRGRRRGARAGADPGRQPLGAGAAQGRGDAGAVRAPVRRSTWAAGAGSSTCRRSCAAPSGGACSTSG